MSKQFDKMDIEQLVQAALREKSWKETIFKIMAENYLVNEFTADVTKQSL